MRLDDVRPRLKAMKRSQADLARHLSLDPSSLVKLLDGKRGITAIEATKFESYFGDALEIPGQPPGARKSRGPARIPVYGYAAAGGDDRIAFAEDMVLDWIDPPPWWSGSGELIYIRLVGDSMEPRYFSGEILPVRLHIPPAKGQDCLILFNDNTALIKNFLGRRDGKVWALQYNERRELQFEATSVRQMHALWKPGML